MYGHSPTTDPDLAGFDATSMARRSREAQVEKTLDEIIKDRKLLMRVLRGVKNRADKGKYNFVLFSKSKVLHIRLRKLGYTIHDSELDHSLVCW